MQLDQNSLITAASAYTCVLPPPSLRAQFAVENHPINQLHGSTSQEEAEREISFFFPQQQTLAVIKPDAMQEHKGAFTCFTKMASFGVCAVVLILFRFTDRDHSGGDPGQRLLRRAA